MRATQEAKRFDADALSRAQHHLQSCFTASTPQALSVAQWSEIREHLSQYRHTLQLLHSILQRALHKAARMDGVGYENAGRPVERCMPLCKRVG